MLYSVMSSREPYLRRLQMLIRDTHNCESRHVASMPVHEKRLGETLWQGDVEVFEVSGHPSATHCFAWDHKRGEGRSELVTRLNLPPVSLPKDAVLAHIAEE